MFQNSVEPVWIFDEGYWLELCKTSRTYQTVDRILPQRLVIRRQFDLCRLFLRGSFSRFETDASYRAGDAAGGGGSVLPAAGRFSPFAENSSGWAKMWSRRISATRRWP